MRVKRLISDHGRYHVDIYGRRTRKVRDLKNGKWYRYWYTLKYSRYLRDNDCFNMAAVHSMAAPASMNKRSLSLIAYYKKNPKELARRIRNAMHNNPDMYKRFVRWFYKTLMWKFFSSEDVSKEEVAAVMRSSKEGRQILEYVTCERKKVYKADKAGKVETGVVYADRF